MDTDMEIDMARKRRRGDAGFTLIDMLFVVALIGLLASLAIPGLMKARGAAQSTSAIGTLRVVNSGELSFAITCGLGFYSPDLPTLGVAAPGKRRSIPARRDDGRFHVHQERIQLQPRRNRIGWCAGILQRSGRRTGITRLCDHRRSARSERRAILRHELGRGYLSALGVAGGDDARKRQLRRPVHRFSRSREVQGFFSALQDIAGVNAS